MPEMFGRRGPKCFVSEEGEIVASGELIDPMIHSADDRAHAQFFVAQHFAHRSLPELERRVRIASCQLQVQRNKTITRISREKDDLRAVKLASRYEIFAANPVPPVAFGAVLKQIMRKHNARKPR